MQCFPTPYTSNVSISGSNINLSSPSAYDNGAACPPYSFMHFIGSWLTCSIINHLDGYSAWSAWPFVCAYVFILTVSMVQQSKVVHLPACQLANNSNQLCKFHLLFRDLCDLRLRAYWWWAKWNGMNQDWPTITHTCVFPDGFAIDIVRAFRVPPLRHLRAVS